MPFSVYTNSGVNLTPLVKGQETLSEQIDTVSTDIFDTTAEAVKDAVDEPSTKVQAHVETIAKDLANIWFIIIILQEVITITMLLHLVT
jgi:hypothetical protein